MATTTTPAVTRRSLRGGAVLSAVSRFAVAGAGALTTVLVARLLGPAGAGAFAVAASAVTMLTVATTLGVGHGVMYYVAAGRWDAGHAWRSVQRLGLALALAGIALGLTVRALVPATFHGLSPWMTIATVAALPFGICWLFATYVALAADRYEAYALPPVLQALATLGLVALLGATLGRAGAIAGLLGAYVLTALATTLWSRRWLPPPAGPPPRGALRDAVGFGLKGYAANALQYVNLRLDLFILNAIAGAAAAGRYAVAVAVTGVLWLLPQALSDVVLPRVAALDAGQREDDGARRDRVEAKSLRHAVLAVGATSAALALALPLLVGPVYGAGFRPAVTLGLILLPGTAIGGVSAVLAAMVVGRGRPDYSLRIALVTTPLTVALYALLIPTLGARGAALASSVSYTLTCALTLLAYRRLAGAGAAARLVPTRAELADYATLARLLRARVRALRR
jgi:O-antigen/teichoic acid export membrane protein